MDAEQSLCRELAGRSFELIMDDGYEYSAEFPAYDTLLWQGRRERCECLKADEQTYLISFEVSGAASKTAIALIIDLENRLVTLVTEIQGLNPRLPTQIKSEVLFGALRGAEVSLKRHGYTPDLSGKALRWDYGGDFKIIHIYLSERYYRIKLLKRLGDADSPYERAMSNYTDRTEPAFYVRIKDGMYLFGFTEINMDRVTPPEIGCSSRVQLINTKTMSTVGRGFSAGGISSMSAVGEFVELPPEDFDLHSAYII